MNCFFPWIWRALAVLLMTGGLSSAVVVLPPSDLKATALGANAFALSWKDNSDNESGWEIFASVGRGSVPESYLSIGEANRTGHVVISNDLPGQLVRFQVRAYGGAAESRVNSRKTSIVEVIALSPATFEAAKDLRATVVNDGTVRLRWTDLSTTEYGYSIQVRKGGGEWQILGTIGLSRRYNITADRLDPGTDYAFRVVAYRGQGQVVTGASNEAKVRTPAFAAPSDLEAKAEGEGSFVLSWKDKSGLEEGYEVQARIEGKKFESLGRVMANATKTSPFTLLMDKPYEFRVRGFRTVTRTVGGKEVKTTVHTAFSNLARRRSTGLARPTDLVVSSTTEQSVSVAWTDVSSRETGYTLRYREVGASLPKVVNLPAGSTSYTVSGLPVARDYEFQVRASAGPVVSRYTPVAVGSTRDQFTGVFDVALTSGVSFLYQIAVTNPANITAATVTDLPEGLAMDAATRTISGVVTGTGVYEAKVKVTFAAGYSIERTLVLRVVAQEGGPVVASSIGDLNVARGSTVDVSVNGKFRDSDVSVARRFTTNIGTFDIVLFEEATPLTVENFLAYADAGRYRNTFFHRAPTGFVVQGGGFTHNGTEFGKVTTFAPVRNEPGISNLAGTVAMAKLGGDPNSATSQFFINLSDENASNLDFQNGGFTVFGRIAGSGMELFEEIDAMPKGDYPIDPGGGLIGFDDVPVNTPAPAPASLDPTKLVKVLSVADAPPVRITVTSLNPEVATAVLNGNTLRVGGVRAGTARIRVRATDLDGLSADQLVTVTVP